LTRAGATVRGVATAPTIRNAPAATKMAPDVGRMKLLPL
jgi:hypothetical protein